MSDIENLYGEDTLEQVQQCLACRKPKCNNCLKHSPVRRLSYKRCAPVYQYDRDMNLINVWPSLYQASCELGINKGNISSAISGRMKTAGGFVWRRDPETR